MGQTSQVGYVNWTWTRHIY